MIRALAPFLMALASPAGAFDLAFPADCSLGAGCYIQQYHDHDPGPEATDYTCGPLSYDGHDGTDIALPTRAAMAAGVNVLAAAPGVVKGLRDGVADAAPFPSGQDCGNGVVIDHGNGWETQYCHLKQGSVRVQTGQPVTVGTALGQIGQSGRAEFPHLHFAVRREGAKIDPFAPDAIACGAAGDDLWASDLPHQPGGILGLGLTDQVPTFDAIKSGLPSPDLPATAPALVVWVYLFGPRAGDAILFDLIGPEGAVVTERVQVEKTQALAFRAVGRKLTLPAWPAGSYTATATLMRDRAELSRQEITLTVAP
jgi:Peptidase family M23